jgi:phage-related protein
VAPPRITGAAAIITQLINGITANMDQIISTTMMLISVIGNALIQNLPQIIEAGVKLIGALVTGLLNAIPKIVASIPQIVNSIKTSFSTVNWGEIGRNIIQGIANGLRNAGSAIVNAAKDAAKSALDAAKNFLGIHSPSTVFRDEVGKNMALGMAEGFQDFSPRKQIGRAINGITSAATGSSTAVNYGGTTINVYAQPGQSAQAIADAVADRINRQVNQRLNAWATV